MANPEIAACRSAKRRAQIRGRRRNLDGDFAREMARRSSSFCKAVRCNPVEEHRQRRRLEGLESLRDESRHHSEQHVSCTARCERGSARRIDRDPSIRSGGHGGRCLD